MRKEEEKVRKSLHCLNYFYQCVIENVMQDFCVNLKAVPTCKKILPILKQKTDFRWSKWTLRCILKEMGLQ
jgi:hypothetical protein